MEPVLIAAYGQLLKVRNCSVDRILEDPELRTEFLNLVRPGVAGRSEREILHALNNLRKKSKLPRRGD